MPIDSDDQIDNFILANAERLQAMSGDSDDHPHNYILTHSGRLQLHGPFENFRQLAAYGLWWSENSGDGSGCDPCWQSVYVEDPSEPLEVIAPSAELWHGDNYATYSYAEYGTFSPPVPAHEASNCPQTAARVATPERG